MRARESRWARARAHDPASEARIGCSSFNSLTKNPIYKIMKSNQDPAAAPQPSEDEIRDYAHHLHVQHGCLNGLDRDDWFEAEACLRANIPKESSRSRLHHHTQITERAALGLIKHGRS